MSETVPAGSAKVSVLSYAAAGVDIDAGERAVQLMRPLIASTARPEVIGGIGGFGGLFAMPSGYREPVLVACTDGVGTKLAVAVQARKLGTVGVDLVAMCADDLVCQGAEPLFLLDYQVWGRLDPEAVTTIMAGIADGCRQAGCSILGGELAEHPGQLPAGDFDLAGFAVGVVERDGLVGRSGPRPPRVDDALIGLHSGGLRSNGYSLVRAALFGRAHRRPEDEAWPGAACSLADELLRPSIIYTPAVLALLRHLEVHAVAHITGGGLPGNLPRVLPPHLDAVLWERSWPVPRIFAEVQTAAGVGDAEMARTFNMGLGMVLALPADQVAVALGLLSDLGFDATEVGRVVAGKGRCLMSPKPVSH
jgi:phosphoribosylformylglycinamidine cyclo-ligase